MQEGDLVPRAGFLYIHHVFVKYEYIFLYKVKMLLRVLHRSNLSTLFKSRKVSSIK